MNVAIVTMTRCPPDFLDWIEYHVKVVGISKIYLRLEGPHVEETMKKLKRYPNVLVLEHHVSPSGDQMVRQMFLVEAAIEKAKEESMDYLLHIDDDELFHIESIGLQGLLRKMDAENDKDDPWDYLHFQNVEAVYPHPTFNDYMETREKETCFQKTKWFNECFESQCRSYGNGKSMTRIDIPEPGPVGVHYFRGKSKRVPSSLARILHFESCRYEDWKTKFMVMSPSKFPFYKESRSAIQQYQSCLQNPSTTTHSHLCEKNLYDFYTSQTDVNSVTTSFKINNL